MLTLSPIFHFQSVRKDDSVQLATAIRTSWMTTSLTYALAEMSIRNATKEELVGARIFIGILMNLGEPIPLAVPAFPDKELGQPTKPKSE